MLVSAQKAATPSPLSFAGRIAKPLRGGGGGVVPSTTIQSPAGPPVSVNPLSRVQNEDGYVNLFFVWCSELSRDFSFLGEVSFLCLAFSFSHLRIVCVGKRASWFFQSR